MTLASMTRQLLPPVLLPTVKAIARPFRKTDPRQVELRKQFDILNRDAEPGELVLREGVRIAIHPESRIPFEMFCYRSPEMVEEMNSFAKLTQGKQQLLDVGALHGVFALAFVISDRTRKAVAIDPSPLAFAKLLYNIHRNQLKNNVAAFELALSDEAGQSRMYYEWEHAVSAPLGQPEGVVRVEKITGDALCERLGVKPDVIKIDVEGHEAKVIKGLASTIGRVRPLLFVELHPVRMEREHDSLPQMLGFIEEKGYRASTTSGEPVEFRDLCRLEGDARIVFDHAHS